MSDGRNTHADPGARVLTAAPLRKLTLMSVFLNGERRNFPFTLVHNQGSSEPVREGGLAPPKHANAPKKLM